MNRILTAILTVGIAVSGMSTAEACCLWPFGGWWGAGYGGYYTAGYAPYVPVADGYYSAGYGSSACCVPVCCDPCGNGGCATGSCVGTTPAGSLKPQTDPNFDRGTKEKDEDSYDSFDRDRLRRRQESTDPASDLDSGSTLTPRRRTAPVDPDPIDDFRSAPMGGTDSDLETFGTGSDQIKNKPPMADPDMDLPAIDPGADADKTEEPGFDAGTSGSTFFDEDSKTPSLGPETRRPAVFSVTSRRSQLNEVVSPKRLASRSLPSTATSGSEKTSVAGKAGSGKNAERAPLRWISVPLPEGHVRL